MTRLQRLHAAHQKAITAVPIAREAFTDAAWEAIKSGRTNRSVANEVGISEQRLGQILKSRRDLEWSEKVHPAHVAKGWRVQRCVLCR